jgi:hypothetical protein
VCNYTVALLKEAQAVTKEPLVANQIEVHPFLDQSKVIAGVARLRHGDHRLLPDRARPRARQSGAGAHRQGAWKDRKPGLAALAGSAGHYRHSRLGQAGAAEGEPRCARLLAQPCRDERDRNLEEAGWARGQPPQAPKWDV